jgi:hypothetical protein
MAGRAWSVVFFFYLLSVCGGCKQASEPQAGPLSAGPYPESRAVTEWIRVNTGDPEAHIDRWVSRVEEKLDGASMDSASVLIEIRYRATRGKIVDGHWKQTLRVVGKHIVEDTPAEVE